MKKIYLIILVLTAMAACKTKKHSKMLLTENEKLINQYFEHFNNHEWDKMANMYLETVEFKDPSLGPGIVKQSRKQIIDKYAELNGIFPDLHDNVLQIYPSGNKNVIVEFVSTGTAPDGVKFQLPICTIFTIEGGMITKDFTYYDNFDEKNEQEK